MSFVKKIVPNSRINYNDLGFDVTIQIGTPIGLLLVLTYAEPVIRKSNKGKSPVSRTGKILI